MSLTPDQLRALFEYPIQPPPSGVIPNFVDSESNGGVLYACAGVCYFLILSAMGFRICARFVATDKRFTWTDGMLLLSAVGVISWISVAVATVGGHAFGRHSWDVKLSFFTKDQLVLAQLTATLYPLWILTIKLSVLLMYLDLFYLKRWLRYWSYLGMAVFTMFHVAFVLIWSVTCRPRGGNDQIAWLAGFLAPSCSRGKTYNVLQAVVNLAGDIFLIILPLPAIWGLNMNTKKKLNVSSMFLTGLCAIVASGVALACRLQLLDERPDNTWKTTYTWTASFFEMTAGILVVCIPSIPVVMKRLLPAIRSISPPKRGLSSSELRHTMTDTSGTTGRTHWYDKFNSTTEKHPGRVTISNGSMRTQSDSEHSGRTLNGTPYFINNSGEYSVRVGLNQVTDASFRAHVGPGKINKTTEFHVGTIHR